MDGIWFPLLLAQAFACAVLCGVVADAKRLNVSAWVFSGLVFGVLGLIAAAGMPGKPLLQTRESVPTADASNTVEKLISELQSRDEDARERAAEALGDLGADAEAAIAALEAALNDGSRRVRTRAEWARQRIRG